MLMKGVLLSQFCFPLVLCASPNIVDFFSSPNAVSAGGTEAFPAVTRLMLARFAHAVFAISFHFPQPPQVSFKWQCPFAATLIFDRPSDTVRQ